MTGILIVSVFTVALIIALQPAHRRGIPFRLTRPVRDDADRRRLLADLRAMERQARRSDYRRAA